MTEIRGENKFWGYVDLDASESVPTIRKSWRRPCVYPLFSGPPPADLSYPAAGDHDKVQRLDRRVTELAGFSSCYTICGQTYPRKVDVQIVQTLASLGATAHKVSTVLNSAPQRCRL